MMDIDGTETLATEAAPNGVSRRQVLRAGAAVGAGLLWVAPVVSGLGLTAAHADSTSGTVSPPPNSPPPNSPPPNSPPPNSPPPNSPPPNSPPPGGTQPVGFTNSPPTAVLGETFGNTPQAGGVAPAAVLPFTGAAAPIKSATVIGAGLVATGAAAIIAANRRQEPAAVSDNAGEPPADSGPKHSAT